MSGRPAVKRTSYFRKIFTIPEDIIKFLENEENQSALISDLLRSYYSLNTEVAGVEREIEKKRRELAALEFKLTEIRSHEITKIQQREILQPWRDYWPKVKNRPKPERERWLEESAKKAGMPVDEFVKILEAD